jgi:hypothetical protein
MDYAQKLREYIPQGDGYNSEFARDLTNAADEIERLRSGFQQILASSDSEMEDGDLARRIAEDMLKTPNDLGEGRERGILRRP